MSEVRECPGCGRHCPEGAPRCGWGMDYFEKNAPKKQKESKEK